MNDYIFRGVTQSNHKPSVAAYFEPRYNVNKDLQLYVGVVRREHLVPNRAAAEVDIYGGIRPTFGMFAFDFGVWGYLYPGGSCCFDSAAHRQGIPGGNVCGVSTADDLPGRRQRREEGRQLLRSLRQGELHHQRQLAVGFNEYYSPNFLNSAPGATTPRSPPSGPRPSTTFGRQRRRHVRVG